jgi:hypothetical protein
MMLNTLLELVWSASIFIAAVSFPFALLPLRKRKERERVKEIEEEEGGGGEKGH